MQDGCWCRRRHHSLGPAERSPSQRPSHRSNRLRQLAIRRTWKPQGHRQRRPRRPVPTLARWKRDRRAARPATSPFAEASTVRLTKPRARTGHMEGGRPGSVTADPVLAGVREKSSDELFSSLVALPLRFSRAAMRSLNVAEPGATGLRSGCDKKDCSLCGCVPSVLWPPGGSV